MSCESFISSFSGERGTLSFPHRRLYRRMTPPFCLLRPACIRLCHIFSARSIPREPGWQTLKNVSGRAISTRLAIHRTSRSLKCWETGRLATISSMTPLRGPGNFSPMKNGWESIGTGSISHASEETKTHRGIPRRMTGGSTWAWTPPTYSIWIKSITGGDQPA